MDSEITGMAELSAMFRRHKSLFGGEIGDKIVQRVARQALSRMMRATPGRNTGAINTGDTRRHWQAPRRLSTGSWYVANDALTTKSRVTGKRSPVIAILDQGRGPIRPGPGKKRLFIPLSRKGKVAYDAYAATGVKGAFSGLDYGADFVMPTSAGPARAQKIVTNDLPKAKREIDMLITAELRK